MGLFHRLAVRNRSRRFFHHRDTEAQRTQKGKYLASLEPVSRRVFAFFRFLCASVVNRCSVFLRNLSTNYLCKTPCAVAGFSLSIRNESRPARLVMCGHRFLNQCLNERGLTRNLIWCAMLRHAERPKGSRRVPYVYRRFILGPFTRSRGSAFLLC